MKNFIVMVMLATAVAISKSDVITTVDVNSVSSQQLSGIEDFQAVYCIDGSGFTESTGYHVNDGLTVPGSMWLSASGDTMPYIIFDLNSPQEVQTVKIWNFNSIPYNAHNLQGVKRMNIGIADSSGTVTEDLGEFTLTAAPGIDDIDFGRIITIDRTNVQYVRFDILETQSAGYNGGLSEVRFYGPTNFAPQVNAGVDFAASSLSTDLNGAVTDDGYPNPPGTTIATWSKVAGPGQVDFDNANDPCTGVTFGSSGVYILKLSATDGELSSEDSVMVSVTFSLPASISGVSILDYSSYYDDGAGEFQVVRCIDGSGFDELTGTHTNQGYIIPGNMWLSADGDTTPYIVFDCNSVQDVGTVRIWNFNSLAWDAYQLQGVKKMKIGIADSGGTVIEDLGEFNVDMAPGSSTVSFGQDITIDRSNVRYIRFDILETQTAGYNAGLSEVRFYNSVLGANTAPVVTSVVDNDYTYVGGVVNLDGTVTDDGNPNPPAATTVTWTRFSGPGEVVFADSSAVDTTAGFDTAGTYVLRLYACDSALIAFSDITINVFKTACDAAFADPDVEALITDLNDDCMVNFLDLAYLAQDWLKCYMDISACQ